MMMHVYKIASNIAVPAVKIELLGCSYTTDEEGKVGKSATLRVLVRVRLVLVLVQYGDRAHTVFECDTEQLADEPPLHT